MKQIVRFKTKTKIHGTNFLEGFPSKIQIEKNRPRRNSLDKKRTDTAALEEKKKKARFFLGRKKNVGFCGLFFCILFGKDSRNSKDLCW